MSTCLTQFTKIRELKDNMQRDSWMPYLQRTKRWILITLMNFVHGIGKWPGRRPCVTFPTNPLSLWSIICHYKNIEKEPRSTYSFNQFIEASQPGSYIKHFICPHSDFHLILSNLFLSFKYTFVIFNNFRVTCSVEFSIV